MKMELMRLVLVNIYCYTICIILYFLLLFLMIYYKLCFIQYIVFVGDMVELNHLLTVL